MNYSPAALRAAGIVGGVGGERGLDVGRATTLRWNPNCKLLPLGESPGMGRAVLIRGSRQGWIPRFPCG